MFSALNPEYEAWCDEQNAYDEATMLADLGCGGALHGLQNPMFVAPAAASDPEPF